MPSRRAQLLAVLILAHLAQITLSSVPFPTKALTEDLKPRHRRAILTWGAPLLALGLSDSEADLIADTRTLNNALVSTRLRLLRPIFRWQKHTGTQQGWRMFGDVPPFGGRLQIHIRTGEGEWTRIFEDHSEADWKAGLLNQERFRGVRASYAGRSEKRRKQYSRLGRWLARHAATDFPQATEFRMRYQKVIIAEPAVIREQGGLALGTTYWEEHVDLEALR
jgi:hypothetical protein